MPSTIPALRYLYHYLLNPQCVDNAYKIIQYYPPPMQQVNIIGVNCLHKGKQLIVSFYISHISDNRTQPLGCNSIMISLPHLAYIVTFCFLSLRCSTQKYLPSALPCPITQRSKHSRSQKTI